VIAPCNLYICPPAFTRVRGQLRGRDIGDNVPRSTAPPLCASPLTRVSPSLVVGAVSPCVQRWAARWHAPPALGEVAVELEGADAAVGWWERCSESG
jgi:hypothetical protein